MNGIVYLLHFEKRIGGEGYKGAQHYVGWARDLERRIWHHRNGTGASITAHLAKNGIGFDVVKTWEADRNFERKLKNNGHFSRHCPHCKP